MSDRAPYALQQKLHESRRSLLVRAIRSADGRPVILKFPGRGYPDRRRTFELHREYALARRVAGDGILEVLALEQFPDGVALVLEDFGGTSLRHLLNEHGPLDVATFLRVALHISMALGQVHGQGVIHKDIKPQNIIINRSTGVIKLADFSHSSVISLETIPPESPTSLTGTLAYMAPEQTGRMNRGVDSRADFYALGATFFELLTGRQVFTASGPLELLHAHVAQRPPSPRDVIPGVPEPLADIVLKLLAKDPDARYQSGWGLISDLQACQRQLDAGVLLRPFVLGTGDRAHRFRLPQGLYGRAADVALLTQAHAQAAAGHGRLLLVTGSAGIGKSSLINELHRVTAASRGLFAAGKCDQIHRGVPFDAVHQALRFLIRQTLAEGEEAAARMRQRIKSALGATASVLAEAIPETRTLLGEQPLPVPLPADKSKNRLTLVLARTLRAFAAPGHPLVLFLDDLQWTDSATLALVQVLAHGPDNDRLLLIGAYRDTEVSGAHPLTLALDELRAAGTSPLQLHLTPLGLEDVTRMVSEASGVELERARELGRVVYSRTGGNPFSVKEFLRFLHEQNLIHFDLRQGRWVWVLHQIEAREIPEDVAGLMAAELRKLPRETTALLRLAACLGVAFGFRDLSLAHGTEAAESARALWPAIERGLVLPLSKDYLLLDPFGAAAPVDVDVPLRFLHDRVRHVAYSLIPEEERAAQHVRIGLLLLEDARSTGTLDERLFTILPHLGRAPESIGPAALRLELTGIHLEAGRRAKASGAYRTACELFRTGVALLPTEVWELEPEQAFALHMELAESNYLAGEFEASAAGFAMLLAQAQGPAQRARVHALQATLVSLSGRHTEALHIGLEGLRLLGVELPFTPAPLTIAAELREVMARLAGRDAMELLGLPCLKEPGIELVVTLIGTIILPAYSCNQELWKLIVLRLVQLSLEHGNSRLSPFGYVIYGVLLTTSLGNPVAGSQFGQLAVDLAMRYQDPMQLARVRFVRAGLINHWTQDARAGNAELMEAYKGSMESGDWLHAGNCLLARNRRRIAMGDPLPEVLMENRRLLASLETSKDPSVLSMALYTQRLLLMLMGGNEPLPEGISGGDGHTWRLVPHLTAAEWHYLLRDSEKALAEAEQAFGFLHYQTGLFGVVTVHFYYALSAAAVYPDADVPRKQALLTVLENHQAYLEKCARQSPENFSPHELLVSAELARVKAQWPQAHAGYEHAISVARASRFPNLEAIACELAFRLQAELGRPPLAAAYLIESLNAYERWGAQAKVDQLVAEQADLLRAFGGRWQPASPRPGQAEAAVVEHSGSSSSTHSESFTETLDMASVMKASQAISSEILFPQLVANLIDIVLESAGAQRGVLVLQRGEDFFVEASGEVGSRSGPLVPIQPLAQSDALCHSLALQVLRTGTHILFDDAASEDSLRADPYIVSRGTRSVLCTPIFHRKQLLGLLYLENNLTAGAFNASRLKVLSMLSTQAAISIENAELYRKLEDYSRTLELRVAERTSELHAKNDELQRTLATLKAMQEQIIVQEKLASLGTLTAGIAHELKNPLNFVKNFSELSLDVLRDLREKLHHTTALPSPEREMLEPLLDDLEVNTAKVCEHGQRATSIIDGMLQHARDTRGRPQPTDLNHLVNEAIRLLRHGMQARNTPLQVTIEAAFDDSVPPLVLVSQDLSRVILNLVDNACYAAHEKARKSGSAVQGQVRVSTRRTGQEVEIRVWDNGHGVPMEVRGKLFMPFFTTKPAGVGTGLGLSISHDIVVGTLGGKLLLNSEEGAYAEFIVVLPVSQPLSLRES